MTETIQDFISTKLAQAIANPIFPALDSQLRAGRHINTESLDEHAFLMDFQTELEEFYRRYHVELIRAPEGFFYLRPKASTLINRAAMSEMEMLVGKVLCYLYLSPERLAQQGIFSYDDVYEEFKFIRTAIDMDKNRVFGQRLRQSIQDYYNSPWLLYTAKAEPLLDLRDDEAMLNEAESVGELPSELEYESLSDVQEQIIATMQAHLAPYRAEGKPIDLGAILREQLAMFPESRHFDVARIIVDQAIKLGMASQDSQAVYPQWQLINEQGAKVQANVIDQFIGV